MLNPKDGNKQTFYSDKDNRFQEIFSKIAPTLKIDEIKSMYNLVKGESTTINIDLRTKK